ncbi:hypothetical protein Tco_1494415 [Tanacetum coccineum]
MEGYEQSHSVSSGNVPNPQDLKRNIQLTGTGLPSTQLDEGTRKSDPKDLVGNKQPIDTGLPSMADHTQSARLRYRSLTKNEGKTSSEVELDFETLQLKTFVDVQALLQSNDEMVQQSDNKEVFVSGEEMDEDVIPIDEEAWSPPPNNEQPESSHAQESDSDSSCPDALKKYDNILPLTERQLAHHEEAAVSYADLRASIEGYYEENVDHRDQTDKLVQATMNCLNKNSIERVDLLKALNGVIETLKVVQEAVKDDPALNRKVIEATEAYTKNSTSLNELVGTK